MPDPKDCACYLVVAFIDQQDKLDSVLRALARRGHGATFMNSLGIGRIREELGFHPAVEAISKRFEKMTDLNITLLSVVEGENAVWDVIGAIEGEIGDLQAPNTALAFAIPISHVTGFIRYEAE